MKIILIILALLLGVYMANDISPTKTTLNKQEDRFALPLTVSRGVNPLVKKLGYLDAIAQEPKNEYVDYDLTLLMKHLEAKGWKGDTSPIEVNDDYGDITTQATYTKGKESIGLTIAIFLPNKNYAAKKFIYDALKFTSVPPPYTKIEAEKGLGTLAMHMNETNKIYWFYRNIYVTAQSNRLIDHPTNLEIELMQELVKIFNQHTKKINE